MDPSEILARASALVNEGDVRQAEALLRSAAVEYMNDATVQAAWARALRLLRRYSDAEAVAKRACKADEALPEAWFNLGGALAGQGRWPEAIDAYRKALAINDAYAEAWNNLGLAFGAMASHDEEIAALRRAVELNPRLAPVWSNLGEALFRRAHYAESANACHRATELAADFPAGWVNLGNALAELNDRDQALRCYDRALSLDDRSAEAWSGRGGVLHQLGDARAAGLAHRRAIELAPDSPHVYQNYGCMLDEETRLDERIGCFRKALDLRPDYADAEWNLALTLLSTGSLSEGWRHYGARWRRRDAEPVRYTKKPWDGRVTAHMRLLVWGEQGIGDEILHAAMLPSLLQEPISVTVECDLRLQALFARSFSNARIIARSQPPSLRIDDFDAQCPFADLGQYYRNSFDAFPKHQGYLRADAMRVTEMHRWIEERAHRRKLLVGLSWRSKNPRVGKAKTLDLEHWLPILRTPGVTWLNLQYGDVAHELEILRQDHGIEVMQYPGLDTFRDIDGVAALSAACDLVITVSNVTAHIAGALAKPVWQMLPRNEGRMWYWFFGRDDSPWYPSMRIFTQRSAEDWTGLVDEVARELATKA